MAAIPYVPNIPAATDIISNSQPQLQTNNNGLNTWTGVDHLNFADGNAGMHKWLEFPNNGTIPTLIAGKLDIFPLLNNNVPPIAPVPVPAAFRTTRTEVFIQPAATIAGVLGNAYPLTATSPLANGFAYLPSGLIMQWGTVALNAGESSVLFPTAFPIACLTVQLTANQASGHTNIVSVLTSAPITNTGFATKSTNTGGGGEACQALFLAIGY